MTAITFERVTAHLDPPFAVVDLAAFDANAGDLARRANGVPIRVVSKSLRCRHLIERTLARPGYRGVMSYSLAEAMWLHASETADDLLVGVLGYEGQIAEYHLIDPADEMTRSVPTYRGEGQCFG